MHLCDITLPSKEAIIIINQFYLLLCKGDKQQLDWRGNWQENLYY